MPIQLSEAQTKQIQAKAATPAPAEKPTGATTRAITLTADQAMKLTTKIPAVRRGSGKRRAKMVGRHIFEMSDADRQLSFAISRVGRRNPGRGL